MPKSAHISRSDFSDFFFFFNVVLEGQRLFFAGCVFGFSFLLSKAEFTETRVMI